MENPQDETIRKVLESPSERDYYFGKKEKFPALFSDLEKINKDIQNGINSGYEKTEELEKYIQDNFTPYQGTIIKSALDNMKKALIDLASGSVSKLLKPAYENAINAQRNKLIERLVDDPGK